MKTPLRPARIARYFTGSTLVAFSIIFAANAPAQAQTLSPAEIRTSRALENVRANPLELEALLTDMPKGTDLHNHLTGAVYAETLIRDAAEDQLCADPSALAFTKPEKSKDDTKGPACLAGNVPAVPGIQRATPV